MKVCPVCKSRCFDDMDVCYGCLHKFSHDQNIVYDNEITQTINLSTQQHEESTFKDIDIPEYFELDTFPYIEEVDYPRTRGAHEKTEDDYLETEKVVLKVELPKSIFLKYSNL